MDMPRVGAINWSAITIGSVTMVGSVTVAIYGSVWLHPNMTVGSFGLSMDGRGPCTFLSAGKQFTQPCAIQMVGGTLTLLDDFSLGASRTLTLTTGTLDLGGFSLSVPLFSGIGTAARQLRFSGGSVTLTGVGNVWNVTASLVLADSGPISITDASASAKTFVGAGLTTYGALTIAGGGAGTVTISGSNAFASMTIGPSKTVLFTAATTQTVGAFNATGDAANLITLRSTTTTRANLSKASGTVSCDWLVLSDLDATGGALWYAGANTPNPGTAAGWIFTGAPLVLAPQSVASVAVAPPPPHLAWRRTMQTVGIASVAVVRPPHLSQGSTLHTVGIASAQAFGVPAITILRAPWTLQAFGVPSVQALGFPDLTTFRWLQPFGVDTAAGIGFPQLERGIVPLRGTVIVDDALQGAVMIQDSL
jgi:hypothetical protein